MKSFEQSLLRLNTPRVDILLIHDVDVWTHGKDMIEQRFKEAMNGAYRALAELREQGVIKGIGVGVNEADMCARFAKAGDFDTMLLAGRYSILEQGALDTFLPLAQEKNIGILVGGVFNSGILATGAVPGAVYNYKPAPPQIVERVKKIEAVCRAHNVALPHAAMQFPLAHPTSSSIVLGAVNPSEVQRNLAGLTAKIPASFWSDLKSEGLILPHAPVPA
jgi:D-threo-aldose 1-dehydrogenase